MTVVQKGVEPSVACDALLADGTPVHVRVINPSDADALIAFHERLSQRTVWLRFFSVHPHLSPREVKRFTTVDHRDREALVAEAAGAIVGVARFDRVTDSRDAEVAIVVDDAWQGHGVGTLLLEHLASRARTLEIENFVADVLPENWRMLTVFRQTGLDAKTRFEDGVVHITIPLQPTPSASEAIEHREHVSEAASIARVLEPRSVAIIGGSNRSGSVGRALVENIVGSGFTGSVYAVHPSATHVAGVSAYPTIAAVPESPDLAIIAVPARAVPAVVEQCGQRGVKGVVIVSSGFAEAGGAGAELQRQVLRTARAHGMRVIGPNCVGIVNCDPAVSLNATFASTVPVTGSVGFLSQSGAVGIVALDAAARTGIGVSTFVSVGNKADVSGNDLLQYWEDDPRTNVAMLYLESLGNPRKFTRLARRISRTKPIVAVKSGRTAAGRRAASSHTAALASSEVAVDALFREAGVIRVDTLREMFAVTRILAHQPVPRGRRVAIVGNSGGPGIMAVDACATALLEVVELESGTTHLLEKLVPPQASTSNPVDLLASAGAREYEAALRAVLADASVDAVVAVFTPTLVADPDAVLDAIAAVAAEATTLSKPLVLAHLTAEDGVVPVGTGGLPRFAAVDEAVLALGRVADRGNWLRKETGIVPGLDDVDRNVAQRLIERVLASTPEGRWLDGTEVADVLAAYGVEMLRPTRVDDVESAIAAAAVSGYPVALKVDSPDVVHKTDVGGVMLDLRSPDELRSAWASMSDLLQRGSAVVQRMAATGVETIAGITVDPTFGPLVLFGLGGTATELFEDRAVRLVPLTDAAAHEMVRSLRTSPLLLGYRGSEPVDAAALESVLLRLAALADGHPEVAEIDLNPVVASPQDAVVVDARVLVRPRSALPPDIRRLPESFCPSGISSEHRRRSGHADTWGMPTLEEI